MKLQAIFGGVLAALLLAGAPAAGQTDPNTGQMAPNETKHVGDWVVRCFPVKSIMPCDMIYILAIKQTGRPVLQLRIAYAPSQDKDLFTIGVPLGVAFAKGLVVTTSAGSTAPMPFNHCDQIGCYIETVMDNQAIDTIAQSGGSAKLVWSFFKGKTVSAPFPLNGFGEARDTLVELAKSHTGTAAPAAPAK
jgi:invasion protein IalB